MSKALFIAEKPSVAKEFAAALGIKGQNHDGYIESEKAVVTWCVGHLVSMSYPEVYDPALKSWSLDTLPFIPSEYKYQVIDGVKKQYNTVSKLLNRRDVDTIYVCTDSGREGEYIYRLVDRQAKVGSDKVKRRVWIDSQTEEEIRRGVKEAKDLSEYDNLGAAAYMRAKIDYLMGINFSRLLTLKYGRTITNAMGTKRTVIAAGRVMTCVLGMVVRREREIRDFVETPFYRVFAELETGDSSIEAGWKSVPGSAWYDSPKLYKDNGFKERPDAEKLISDLKEGKEQVTAVIKNLEKKKEKKNPPLLYNLAELQNDCSRLYKISPDQTLSIVQELYEKKLTTYPRTDARVLSTAVAKEIYKNISGLKNVPAVAAFAEKILEEGKYKNIANTRYVNDKQITDHYAVIPTGQGIGNLKNLKELPAKVYELIARRFLSIFYPPAVYEKITMEAAVDNESFFAAFKGLLEQGYLEVAGVNSEKRSAGNNDDMKEESDDRGLLEAMRDLKKGQTLKVKDLSVKEGKTSPPKRYNSGSIILAMENAGQLIENEELREQIKGQGIGTSATRAEILKKLFDDKYLSLNKKTQIIYPTFLGENVYDVVDCSIRALLRPDLTASWEKGLGQMTEGTINESEYINKLSAFIRKYDSHVKTTDNSEYLKQRFAHTGQYYK